MKNPRAGTETWLTVALLALSSIYAINLIFLGYLIGPFDFDHLSGYYDLAWRFWRSGAGIPHFNPFLCGGRTLGADPQIPIFSPLTWLVPLLGPTLVIKWEMAAQLAVGSWGLWQLLHRLEVPRVGRLWSLFLYLAGGATITRVMVGHVTLGFFFLFPLLLWFSMRLADIPFEKGHRLRAGYWCLLTYCCLYKPNFLIYGLPLLVIETLARAYFTGSIRPGLELLAATVVATLVNAVSLLPAWEYFRAFPRTTEHPAAAVPIYTLIANLLAPPKTLPKWVYGEPFLEQRHEYSLFFGPVGVITAVLGIRELFRTRKKSEPKLPRKEWRGLLVLLVASLWLGLSTPTDEFSFFFPFSWLRAIWPGFQSVRVPTRLWFGASIALSLFAGLGLPKLDSRKKRIAFASLAILPLLASATVNLFRMSVEAKQSQWTSPRLFPSDVVAVKNETFDEYRHLREGKSVLNCTYNIELNQSPSVSEQSLLATSLTAREGALSFDGSELSDARWRAWNRIQLNAVAAGPFNLTLNLSHSPYWKLEGMGSVVSEPGERLSLNSFRDRIEGELVFEQPGVTTGLSISVGALWLLVAYAVFALLRTRGNTSATRRIAA